MKKIRCFFCNSTNIEVQKLPQLDVGQVFLKCGDCEGGISVLQCNLPRCHPAYQERLKRE